MALRECKECGAHISENAAMFPNCGDVIKEFGYSPVKNSSSWLDISRYEVAIPEGSESNYYVHSVLKVHFFSTVHNDCRIPT